MTVLSVEIVEVVPQRRRGHWYYFEHNSEFRAPWWGRDQSSGSEYRWISISRGAVEVARCKFSLYVDSPYEAAFGSMADGHLDILALEVARSQRRMGIGRATLLALRQKYPKQRFTSLNDNATSRGFWDSVGWVRYETSHPLLSKSERVNYSEV
ncbi:GNAT family N-acetyltransferase [Microbacterium maritypicum]|uniref:GNAT family N-acetyltransferase n=1 Tax=Microbacterium maritypicum TaxID=33918 RepID=UPI003557CC14